MQPRAPSPDMATRAARVAAMVGHLDDDLWLQATWYPSHARTERRVFRQYARPRAGHRKDTRLVLDEVAITWARSVRACSKRLDGAKLQKSALYAEVTRRPRDFWVGHRPKGTKMRSG